MHETNSNDMTKKNSILKTSWDKANFAYKVIFSIYAILIGFYFLMWFLVITAEILGDFSTLISSRRELESLPFMLLMPFLAPIVGLLLSYSLPLFLAVIAVFVSLTLLMILTGKVPKTFDFSMFFSIPVLSSYVLATIALIYHMRECDYYCRTNEPISGGAVLIGVYISHLLLLPLLYTFAITIYNKLRA